MRLFIAINFESDIVSALTDLQSGLRDCGAEGNFTRPENLHLTLAFIGEYGNPQEILEILEEVPFRPVELKYAGLQYFRDMYFARFEDNPGLNSYVRRLRRALAEHDIPFDRKKFMPHITLIRRVDFKYGQLTDLPEEPELHITANRISLMKSEHGKNGMVYTELGGIE